MDNSLRSSNVNLSSKSLRAKSMGINLFSKAPDPYDRNIRVKRLLCRPDFLILFCLNSDLIADKYNDHAGKIKIETQISPVDTTDNGRDLRMEIEQG
ncbi:hypothetical protein OnM2_081028 [Erysiphe neolycopersici]|uniref:Uncharacterized protein n=1 Tax=Erysiphe neolycopersici TaxID=212602 RepID=A0A420HFZ3_9PEZI|nr:hypothetical protein OnM2_081028 [Erysiphe neolycopersici]